MKYVLILICFFSHTERKWYNIIRMVFISMLPLINIMYLKKGSYIKLCILSVIRWYSFLSLRWMLRISKVKDSCTGTGGHWYETGLYCFSWWSGWVSTTKPLHHLNAIVSDEVKVAKYSWKKTWFPPFLKDVKGHLESTKCKWSRSR